MMKYMLLMYANEAIVGKFSAEDYKAANQVWKAFQDELQAGGVLEANSGLSPVASATSVRVRDGKTVISDGPFAETHEQLGGYYVLECKELDAYERSLNLCQNSAERVYLQRRLDEMHHSILHE